VTCGDRILSERAELGFRYCTKPHCVRENHKGMVVIEIAQHKTNPEYVVLDGDAGDRALQNMRDGKYRRDPVVVKRESSAARFDVPKATFAPPTGKKDPPNRVKFVQALHDQGYGVDDILKKGAYMNLSRREVVRYMTGRRR
jgi:hypothetical protein